MSEPVKPVLIENSFTKKQKKVIAVCGAVALSLPVLAVGDVTYLIFLLPIGFLMAYWLQRRHKASGSIVGAL
ncbi:hypothetical protein [Kiloniella sp.]|uniref:hypothetical protein n=1 Tax=Kiloniella sp. TaxID=1938587 RepID=UPI003B010598